MCSGYSLRRTLVLPALHSKCLLHISGMTKNVSNQSCDSSQGMVFEPLDIWYWTIRAIIAVLTVIGNGFVIYLILCRRRLQVASNWFVLSLTVADFCIGFFVTPCGFACTFYFRCEWYLQIVFYNFMLFSSTTSLWVLAVDRYLSIMYSLRYTSMMTNKRIFAMVVAAWGSSFATTFVRLLWFNDCHNYFEKNIDNFYRLVMDFFVGIGSCLILIFIYLRVLFISRKVARQIKAQENEVNHNYEANELNRSLSHVRQNLSTSLLGSVVSLFVLCNSLSVFVSFSTIFKSPYLKAIHFKLAYLLVHLNSFLNALVYALVKKDIRLEIRRTFHCSN